MKTRNMWVAVLIGIVLWGGPAAVADAKPFAFPAVDGWTPAGQPQVFSPDTLYDYINGGSDLYLKYDFEELQVVEYRKGKMSVLAEVYRHRDADHAFGIYSQERVPSAAFLALGAQGYYETAVCNFIQGGYYVKLSSDGTGSRGSGDPARRSPDGCRRSCRAQTALPAVLSVFPAEGKKPSSEKFIAKDFLGYAFLHAGFIADYERAGQKYQLFVIAGDSPADTRAMLGQYLKQIKQEADSGRGGVPGQGPLSRRDGALLEGEVHLGNAEGDGPWPPVRLSEAIRKHRHALNAIAAGAMAISPYTPSNRPSVCGPEHWWGNGFFCTAPGSARRFWLSCPRRSPGGLWRKRDCPPLPRPPLRTSGPS